MKLSIIVPVYNLEDYIATTLDSLLSIHFSSDYEIIMINDGSTDDSESIIRGYQMLGMLQLVRPRENTLLSWMVMIQ